MILCSGNPTHNTVASGVREILPNCDFASRATGYDLRFWDKGSEDHFRKNIVNYTVFINSSFICGGGQLQLLEACHQEWSTNNIKGHIINIGSSAECLGATNDLDEIYGKYSIQKRALRDRSLQLSNINGIKTTHVTLGGINDGKPGHEEWLKPVDIAENIKWILDHKLDIKQIYIEQSYG
jgi:hypothetical protein